METKRFDELGLSKKILKAVELMGFEEATPIQSLAIPVAMEGKDIIGQAQTGTGKTAAFSIPLIEKINLKSKKTQAIILCPTRELAVQVAGEIASLATQFRGLYILPVYGGQPIERQFRALQRGAHIVVGTPGRVIDHINRGTLKLGAVETLVLDEADEMLDMGFREDIEEILKTVPAERQTFMFSATMPRPILNLIDNYMNEPVNLKVQHKELTVPVIEQYYIEVREKNRVEVMSRLLDFHSPNLTMVFCNTKRKVDESVASLQARGYFADALHGDMKQHQRDVVMKKFKEGTIEILVATDVAARGIDVDNVEMVINYDVPQDLEYYVHRIGRTGRAGRKGKAYTLVFGKEFRELRDIERYTKRRILKGDIPSVKDVEDIRYRSIMDRVSNMIESENLEKEIKLLDMLSEYDYESDLIAAAFLKLYMDTTSSVNDYEKIPEETSGRFETLMFNIGKKDNVKIGDIVGAISGETGVSGNKIGKIKMENTATYVDIPRDDVETVIRKLKNKRLRGKRFTVISI